MIALRLYQTCKDPAAIPARYAPLVAAWGEFCARQGWHREIFDDAAMDAFVREEDPQGYALYRDLETIVEKTDYWRYLVVLRRGGYYADLDTRPREAFARMKQPAQRPIVQVEKDQWWRLTRSYCQLPEIAQFFFGFPAGSPVLAQVMDEMKRRLRARPYRRLGRFQEILFNTGPGVFGAVVVQHRDAVDFFPEDGLVEHLFAGSWTAGLERGPNRLLFRRWRLNLQPVP